MKSKAQIRIPHRLLRAFTLIELLVVIAVIAILAGLLFTAIPAISKARMMATTRAELTQITTAIEAYKAVYNSYPPDNPNNVAQSPLYFELMGVTLTGSTYKSLDGGYTVPATTVHNAFGVPGILNSGATAQATDDRPAIQSFLKDLKPGQIGTNAGARILLCSATETPWRYRSTNPTNNPGSYDLWVEVVAGNRTNIVANWNR